MKYGNKRKKTYALICLIIWYFADKMSYLYHLFPASTSAAGRIAALIVYYKRAFKPISPSFALADMLAGAAAAGAFLLFALSKTGSRKNYRSGEEYGSARWGAADDIRPYMDKDPENNIILTQTEQLTMNSRPGNAKYARNKNVMVIGGSGSGKTRFFVKPNILQCCSRNYPVSFVITDPKGTLITECGKALRRGSPRPRYVTDSRGVPKQDRKGNLIVRKDWRGRTVYERDEEGRIICDHYRIKVFNTIDFSRSMHYNPFAYIRSEEDILKLVNVLIANTKGEGEKSGEDFWVKAERLLYEAYIGFIWYEAPEEEKNFSTLLRFLQESEVREEDETFKNKIDILFDELESTNPDHFAAICYRQYKLAAGKTAKSILISCSARLAPFNFKVMREITEYDELELDLLGDRRTALFVIISDTDPTFNFLVSIMYSQLFNLLCDRAVKVYDGRLPVHVRCLLDEFANIGQIPNFDQLISIMRSREISASIILQAKSQLKKIYKEAAGTIEGNCDSILFLGGREESTLKEISETLGKETIDLYNTSDSRGQGRTRGTNWQKTGRELMTRDELAVLDGEECILLIRGVRPFKSRKYDLEKHPRYRLLSDYDKRNAFDVARYLKHNLDLEKRDPEEEVTVMHMAIPGSGSGKAQ